MQLTKNISDKIGVLASITCMVHCAITPLIFIAQICSQSCCSQAPLWWRSLDYVFLVVTFFAILQTNKKINSINLQYLFWFCWVLLTLSILNESLILVNITHHVKYIPALAIVCLHIYNIRNCRFQGEECCVHSTGK